jgi:hypothetical protein
MRDVKAIHTIYNGINMRSRFEVPLEYCMGGKTGYSEDVTANV